MTSRAYLDSQGTPTFICAPDPLCYVAQVRGIGCRNWRTVGEYADKEEAARQMLEDFLRNKRAKRGRVIARYAWYDPSQCMEITR